MSAHWETLPVTCAAMACKKPNKTWTFRGDGRAPLVVTPGIRVRANNGDVLAAGGANSQIYYGAGTGNDVVLTEVPGMQMAMKWSLRAIWGVLPGVALAGVLTFFGDPPFGEGVIADLGSRPPRVSPGA